MALTFECFNSVDRTVPLVALLGSFRFVCSNGLVVGTTHASLCHRHRPPLRIDELEPVLTEGLVAAARDRERLTESMASRLTGDALRTWVDGPVANGWGAFAAARVHAIATTGLDGEPSRTPRAAPPHARKILNPRPVPGAEAPCTDAYGLAQALAWVAARRTTSPSGSPGAARSRVSSRSWHSDRHTTGHTGKRNGDFRPPVSRLLAAARQGTAGT